MRKILTALTAGLLVLTIIPSALIIKNGGATLHLINNTTDTVTGSAIVALYTDGELKRVQVGERFSIEPNAGYAKVFDFENYASGSEVAGFFWKGTDKIEPLGNKVILSSATVDDETYTGDYILAVNTDTTADLSTGALPQEESAQLFSLLTEPTEEDRQIYVHLPIEMPEQSTESEINFSINTTDAEIEVGTTKSFNVIDMSKSNQPTYTQEFICKAVGEWCYIWVANGDVDMDDVEYEFGSLDIVNDEVAKNIAKGYDDKIRPLLVNNFGEMNDHDGDKKISLLFYDIQDGYNGDTQKSYIGGYFYSADLFSNSKTGNATDMLHIDTYPLMAKAGANNTYSTIVHELQHFVNYSWLENSPDQWASYKYANWSAFNEAMSMAAEHIFGGALQYRVDIYNDIENVSTYNADIRDGMGFLNWDNSIPNYTMSYLFGQYLRTLTQGYVGGGTAIYRSIMDGLPSYNIEGITAQVNKVMYGDSTEKYMTSNELIASFRLALILRDDFGPYGFKGEEPFDSLNLPIYGGDGITLERSGAVLIKNNGDFQPTVSNTNMKFYGITLPQE